MTFKKLALVTAIAAAPVAGFSMEALDDSALSGVTGQEGITITMTSSMTIGELAIEDGDGTATSGFGNAGAIVLFDGADGDTNALAITAGATTIAIDAGGDVGDGSGNGHLRVAITTGTTVITLDQIGVADSDGDISDLGWGTPASIVRFDGTSITMGAGTSIVVELGTEVDNFATISGTVSPITIGVAGDATQDMGIIDGSSGEEISFGSISIGGSGGITTGFATNVTANVETTGLVIGMSSTTLDIYIEDLQLGSAPVLGDIYIDDLAIAASTITIAGH